MKKFTNNFNTMFAGDKPNASVTHWDMKGKFNNHVHEILKIKRKGNKFTIKTNLTEGDYINEIFPDVMNESSNTFGIPNPFSINQANFFIDSTLLYLHPDMPVT